MFYLKKSRILLAACMMLIIGAVAFMPQQVMAEEVDDTILDGVSIGNVDVGGMNAGSAQAAVEAYLAKVQAGTTYLVGDIGEVKVDNLALNITCDAETAVESAMGLGKSGNLIARYKEIKDAANGGTSVPMNMKVDETATIALFEKYSSELENEPVDYGLKRENGSFTVIEGQNGVAIDTAASIDGLDEFLNTTWSLSDNRYTLAVVEEQPQGSAEELAKVTDLLGSYSTDYSSSASGRAQNVRNGASKIDGTVLYPGEQFSVHDTVVPFDAENGYALAGSYENGTTVETYGGGICQVSTTLYNAVIRAELQVDERFAHSMIVGYVQPSMDAAIAGDYKDLKFTNNTDAPIYIEGYTSGGIIYFNIYGQEYRDASRTVKFESETLSTTEPETEFVADSSLAIGTITQTQSSHTGYTAQLWKIVYENGVEVSRTKWNSSTYNASPRIYSVGTSSDNSEAVSAMKSAIASGDEDTIRAAAAKWNAKALEKAEKEAEKEAEKADSQTSEETNKSDGADNGSSNTDSSDDGDLADTTTSEQ